MRDIDGHCILRIREFDHVSLFNCIIKTLTILNTRAAAHLQIEGVKVAECVTNICLEAIYVCRGNERRQKEGLNPAWWKNNNLWEKAASCLTNRNFKYVPFLNKIASYRLPQSWSTTRSPGLFPHLHFSALPTHLPCCPGLQSRPRLLKSMITN